MKIDSPIYLTDGIKGKKFALNLNIYRNAHYFKLNQMKELYGIVMYDQVKDLPQFERLTIKYVLFTGSKRRVDISNICSIVDKFFCDVLRNLGKIPDDDYSVIPKIEYEFGGIDPKNPRVEIYLTEF